MKNKFLKSKIFSAIIILYGVNSFSQSNDNVTKDSSGQFTSSNLPIIVINTHGRIIADEPKIQADMGIIYNGETIRNNITDSFNDFNGKTGIEIRGSSSQMFPKKQYSVETDDSLGNDLDVSLLGLPKESDWILFGPYNDKSLIRDALTYKIFNSMGRYATRSKYCDLVLNNEYMGIYILFEKIKRNKNRVNISKMTPADTSGDNLTGGYIIKIDKTDAGSEHAGWASDFLPFTGASQRIYYQYDYPDPDYITSQQKLYIQNTIHSFEGIMSLPGYADSVKGYAKYIDVNSFIDYILLNEFTKNVDAYRLSAFMYKDRDSIDGKIKMGPVWDYNLAFGNSDYYNASITQGFHLTYLTTNSFYKNTDQYQPPFWWKKLFDDTYFMKKVNIRWNELRKDELSQDRIFSYIDSLTTLLTEARVRNFQKWNVLGRYIWPNYFIGKTYEEEINYLKGWIKTRLSWLDSQFPANPVSVEMENDLNVKGFYLFQNYPNPFNPATNFGFRISSASGGGFVTLKVYDILGNEVATLINEEKEAGRYEISFDAGGLSSGVYFYRLTAGDFSQTKKLILLK